MKKTIHALALALTLTISTVVAAFAHPGIFTPQLEREVLQKEQLQQHQPFMVNITFTWHKINWFGKDIQKTTFCNGVFTTNSTVILPTVCLKHTYQLLKTELVFSNREKLTLEGNSLSARGQIAQISVPRDLLQRLPALAVAPTEGNKTLQDKYGKGMSVFLEVFFKTRGMGYAPVRYEDREYEFYKERNLQVGTPIIYQGHVVALVQEVPKFISTNLRGQISESSLALIR